MTQKKYRGLSPVFAHEKDGTVTRIISAALTNSPNLGQLASLNTEQTHTQSGADMDIATLRAALGLPETADEAAVLTAIATQKQTVAAHTATITNLQAATVPLAEFVALQTQEKAVAFIDAAIKDGKALGPVRERMIAMHVADPAGAEALVAGLPSLKTAAGGTYVAEHDAGDGDGLTAMDSQVIKKMGLKKEDFLKTKKSMAEGSAA
jgi:phage I-like protein